MDTNPTLVRVHGHHKIAAAVFVGLLVLSCALILAAELVKPSRYEFRAIENSNTYMIFDHDSGRATIANVDAKKPLESLDN